MADIRISEVAEITGLSMRYWQRRVSAGEVPGARYIVFGKRKGYLVDAAIFSEWWSSQLKEVAPCPRISVDAGKSGGTGSATTRKTMRAPSKQRILDKLKIASNG